MELSSSFILVLGLIPLPTYALERSKVRLGQNATITFSHTLTGDSIISELFTLQQDRPFYFSGELDPTALRPDQVERFQVFTGRVGKNYTVTLHISDLHASDSDVYILAIRETLEDGHSINNILDAYLEVHLPPGEAVCNVTTSTIAPTWNEVHCNASVGSEGSGHLVCFQHSAKVPIYKPVARPLSSDENLLSSIFWMQPDYPINCCCTDTDVDVDSQTCTDFVHNSPKTEQSPTFIYGTRIDNHTSDEFTDELPMRYIGSTTSSAPGQSNMVTLTFGAGDKSAFLTPYMYAIVLIVYICINI